MRIAAAAASVVLLATAPLMASAAPVTFNFGLVASDSTGAHERSFTATNGLDTVTVSAYREGSTTNPLGRLFQDANVTNFSGNGLGILSGSEANSPQHSGDNDGRDEVWVMDFGRVVDLQSFSIGWSFNDSDMSVFIGPNSLDAVDFNNACFNDGGCTNTLAALGFQRQDHLNVPVDQIIADINQNIASNRLARYVLIGPNNDLDNLINNPTVASHDYVKLETVTVDLVEVPVPAPLMLIGLGFAGMLLRRK